MDHCFYFQAHVIKEKCWFFVAILRSFEHMAFDRTLDKKNSIFELYVPGGMEVYFEKLMAYFIEQGIVTQYKKLPNRLLASDESL